MCISGRQFGGDIQLGEMSDREGKQSLQWRRPQMAGSDLGHRGGGWMGLGGQLDGEEEGEENHPGLLTH